jgi:hypothetical protein
MAETAVPPKGGSSVIEAAVVHAATRASFLKKINGRGGLRFPENQVS